MTAIELLKPHRHAGRDYLAGGQTLRLAPHKADWLIAIGTAKPAPRRPHPSHQDEGVNRHKHRVEHLTTHRRGPWKSSSKSNSSSLTAMRGATTRQAPCCRYR
ncbi:hypothetical protein MASR1M50_08890 [Burkholderiales bacterium]